MELLFAIDSVTNLLKYGINSLSNVKLEEIHARERIAKDKHFSILSGIIVVCSTGLAITNHVTQSKEKGDVNSPDPEYQNDPDVIPIKERSC